MVELRGERVAVGHAMSRKTQNTRSSRLKTLEPPGGLGSVPSPANSCYCRILLELGFSGTRSVLPMETNGSSSFIQITGNQILLLSLSLSVQVTGHVSETSTLYGPGGFLNLYLIYSAYNIIHTASAQFFSGKL